MRVRWRRARELADRLLAEHQIVRPPVPVERLARDAGAKVIYQPYEEQSISGFLFRDSRRVVIGVNSRHSENRQRFTIAHELGHYFLHELGDGVVHIDKAFQVRLRDDSSSQGTDIEEIEANTFAAELLMPMDFVKHDFNDIGFFDIEDEEVIRKMADCYKVSTQALHLRLGRLGYITL